MRRDEVFTGGEGPKEQKTNNDSGKVELFGPLQDYEICLFVYGAILCLAFISVIWLIESHPLVALGLGIIIYIFKHKLVKLL